MRWRGIGFSEKVFGTLWGVRLIRGPVWLRFVVPHCGCYAMSQRAWKVVGAVFGNGSVDDFAVCLMMRAVPDRMVDAVLGVAARLAARLLRCVERSFQRGGNRS